MQYNKARDYGFPGKVEEVVERRSYPHRNRNAVGETPEPHYTLQDRFRLDNHAFKGYGIDPKAPVKDSCPFGRDDAAVPILGRTEALRPMTGDGSSLPKTEPRAHAAQTQPVLSYPCRVPSAQFQTRIEPMSSPRARNTPSAQPRQPCTVLQSIESPARVPRGQHPTSSGDQVAAVMRGYPGTSGANKVTVSKAEQPRPQLQDTAPAGRPTSSQSQRGVFEKLLTPTEMSSMLDRCGALFEGLQNTETFNRVWLHASGGLVPASQLSVATFRKSIDALGL
jgi:hypothetical protein